MEDKNEPKYSKLCMKCLRPCKQQESVTVVVCPHFKPAPVQMMVPLQFPRGRPKKGEIHK